jgi:PPM family protein phosphatase
MIRLEAATLTDSGKQRDVNEDSTWQQVCEASNGKLIGLFIVCDGMGGHMGGEYASHWAIETIRQSLVDLFTPRDPRATVLLTADEVEASLKGAKMTRKLESSDLDDRIREAVQKANEVVYHLGLNKPAQAADAGATVTMALVKGNLAVIANVGDSRTYLLRNHTMRQISRDHSLVATLVESGQIRPEELFSHPQRSLIYRSLGQKNQIQVDTFLETIQKGDTLLLCSDGLWEMVQDESVMMQLIESASSPDEACHKLVEAANLAGGEDNIGVVVVRVT